MNPATRLSQFKTDLHIHTVLSPCGSLEMSPINIIRTAARKGLDIIGITDHNSTLHCNVVKQLGKEAGIFVLSGIEITSSEEAHCLAFFEYPQQLIEFQKYIDDHILKIHNDPDKFGYQVVVDKDENIIGQVDWLLINATNQSVDQLATKTHELDGIFIPAHIDRSAYSLTSQLGFVPPELEADGYEVSKYSTPQKMINAYPWLTNKSFITSSDAHFLKDIGAVSTLFNINTRSFLEIKQALRQSNGRFVKTLNLL